MSDTLQTLVDFFATRLLQKRYRRDNRVETPPQVEECEKEFTKIAERAVATADADEPLDAMVWLDICSDFSAQWMEVCHWVSPKKFREFLTEVTKAEWVRVEEIPAEREQPPRDLKWYKKQEGTDTTQPYLCPACTIVCNSIMQFKAHASGRVHKANAKEWSLQNGGAEPQAMLCGQGTGIPIPTKDQRKGKRASMQVDVPQTQSNSASSPSLSWVTAASHSPMSQMTPAHTPLSPTAASMAPACDDIPNDAANTSQHSELLASLPFHIKQDVSASQLTLTPQRSRQQLQRGHRESMISLVESSFSSSKDQDSSSDDLGLAEENADDMDMPLTRVESLLDQVYPVSSATLNLKALSQATQDKIQLFDGLLAQLAHDKSPELYDRVLQHATELAPTAADHVLSSLIDAAVQSDSCARIAQITASLAKADRAGFHQHVQDVINGAVEETLGEKVDLADPLTPSGASVSVQKVLTVLQYNYSSKSEIVETKNRFRYRGLVRFVAELVGCTILPAATLLRCLQVSLKDALAEDVTSALTAITMERVSQALDSYTRAEARRLFITALNAKYYPNYVKAMVAPFVSTA